MNVRINLDFVEGEDVDEISTRLDDVVRKSSSYLTKIKSKVFERLGWK